MGLTTVFIAIAVITSSLLMARHFLKLETEWRQAYRRLVQAEILKDYQAISEESYLELGGVELHERDLGSIIGDKGMLTLTLEPTQRVPLPPEQIEIPALHWENGKEDSDNFSIRLLFGDVLIGTLKGHIGWKTDRLPMYITIGILTLVLLVCSFALSLVLRRRVVTPLLDEFVRLQQFRVVGEM